VNQRTRTTDEAERQAQSAMSTAHSECNRIYTNVDSTRDRLRASWQGAAANSYSEAVAGWLEELRLITNDMNRMIGTYGGTVHAMHATEDAALITGSRWMSELNPNQSG
jgi:WXG100 family type VII secretion target